MKRGRPTTLHDPVKTTIWIERTDKEAVKAAGLTDSVVYRQGLKHCVLNQRPKSEVLNKLADNEAAMAGEHEVQAMSHRHREQEYRAKLAEIVPGENK